MAYRILIRALLFVAGPLSVVAGRRLPHIYWNSTNNIFDIANLDHVMQVEIGDQVSIVCPEPGAGYEFTQLHMVSEEEYNHCALIEEKPKLIGACTDDEVQSSLSIVFRKYSPVPGGLEFQPGHKYYVISTSNGTREGLENRREGLCSSAKMKIKFEVGQDHHHHKSARHDNPKFLATRMNYPSGDSTLPSEMTTDQVEYIIHESTEGLGDDDASSSLSLLPTVLLLSIGYLLRQ